MTFRVAIAVLVGAGTSFAAGVMAILWRSSVVLPPGPAEPATVAHRIRAVIGSLVTERQALRDRGTDRPALEANRLALVYWQQELSKRLAAGDR